MVAIRVAIPGVPWRGLGVVAAVSLLLSTQIFFQAGIEAHLASGRIFDGWLDLLGEALACGMAMWIAVTTLDRVSSLQRPLAGAAAAGLALFAGALAGLAAFLAVVQPPGFFPPLTSLAGDALRWSLWGAMVWAARAEVRRASRATRALAHEALQQARLEKRRMQTELEVLRAQVEPHFLFNALAHVRRLYRTAPPRGADMLSKLAQYLRAALPQIRASESTLARELELARAYLEVIEIRVGDGLRYSLALDEDVASQPIPAFTVMTLVENAVKHGIGANDHAGSIAITAFRQGARVRVEVADDGGGLRGVSGHGVGLANTRARLRAAFGREASVSLAARSPRGCVAALEFPVCV